ncbi:MAG: extracellular matrix/biofilm biosynthesis regulator RemA family protein [Chloroflexota bacterium]
MTELVHIGFENILAMNRVLALLSPNQQPVKRLIREAKEKDLLIDATHGRKIKAVIVLDTGHITLAAVSPEAIVNRAVTGREGGEVKPSKG